MAREVLRGLPRDGIIVLVLEAKSFLNHRPEVRSLRGFLIIALSIRTVQCPKVRRDFCAPARIADNVMNA